MLNKNKLLYAEVQLAEKCVKTKTVIIVIEKCTEQNFWPLERDLKQKAIL